MNSCPRCLHTFTDWNKYSMHTQANTCRVAYVPMDAVRKAAIVKRFESSTKITPFLIA